MYASFQYINIIGINRITCQNYWCIIKSLNDVINIPCNKYLKVIVYIRLDPGPVRRNYCFVSVHIIRILFSLFIRCAFRIIKITYYLSSTSSFCILSSYLNAVFGWSIQRVLFMSFSLMSWFIIVLSYFHNHWYTLLTLTSWWRPFVKEVAIWIPQFIVRLICSRSLLILSSILRPSLSEVYWQQFFVFLSHPCYMYCVSSWFVHMFGEENKLSNSSLHKYSTALLLPPF